MDVNFRFPKGCCWLVRTNPKPIPEEVQRAIAKWEKSKRVSVLSDKIAAAALAQLFWCGCDPLTVLSLLANFAGVGINLGHLRKRMKSFLKRVTALSRRLEEDAKEVRAVDKFLRLELEFPDEMQRFSSYIKEFYTEEVRSTVLSRGTGLQAELVDAVQLVRTVTGRPHYAELAELVRVLSNKPIGEDNLRKQVDAFSTRLYGPRGPRQIQRLAEYGNAKWNTLRRTLQNRKPIVSR